MSYGTFSQIFFWVFVITNIVFGALFVWKTYVSYRAADAKKTIIIKGIVSFLIWLISTLVIIGASAIYFYDDTIERPDRPIRLESATFYLISFIIGWILIGAAIVYWMSRPLRQKDYGSN